MTDKQIIVDNLSCDNCPEAQRCQEQRAKKEYAINQVLQDIPSEYTNVITRLRQIIPSITRCDYVLEKQLKHKEQECEELKRQYKELGQCSKRMKEYFEKEKETLSNRFLKLKQILAEIKEIIEQGVKIHDDIIVNKQLLQKISEVVK